MKVGKYLKKLNIIPGFPSTILLQYLRKQITISFSVDIDLPLNDPRYLKFYTYVTFKNGKEGLEFMNLSDQSFPQDFPMQGYNQKHTRQQVNSTSFQVNQFINLGGKDKIIRMKLFIMKYHYE